jgi:hypothetical protein
VALGVATNGFIIGGAGMGLRGTASLNLLFIGAWLVAAFRLRTEYVRTIQMSMWCAGSVGRAGHCGEAAIVRRR